MVEKEETKTKDEIKEKEKAEVVKEDATKEGEKEEIKKEAEIETITELVTEPVVESVTDASKADVTEGPTKEPELEDDPWSTESWKETFPELFEKEKEEPIIQKAEGLGEADVIRIVREQLKIWLKGVSEGKYPLPKGLVPSKEPYPEKSQIKGLDEEFEKSKAVFDSYEQKFDDISKTFVELKKELQIIKDTPVDLMEKSIDEDKNRDYVSPFAHLKDGTITQKK